jgi:hypothetical protein
MKDIYLVAFFVMAFVAGFCSALTKEGGRGLILTTLLCLNTIFFWLVAVVVRRANLELALGIMLQIIILFSLPQLLLASIGFFSVRFAPKKLSLRGLVLILTSAGVIMGFVFWTISRQ